MSPTLFFFRYVLRSVWIMFIISYELDDFSMLERKKKNFDRFYQISVL